MFHSGDVLKHKQTASRLCATRLEVAGVALLWPVGASLCLPVTHNTNSRTNRRTWNPQRCNKPIPRCCERKANEDALLAGCISSWGPNASSWNAPNINKIRISVHIPVIGLFLPNEAYLKPKTATRPDWVSCRDSDGFLFCYIWQTFSNATSLVPLTTININETSCVCLCVCVTARKQEAGAVLLCVFVDWCIGVWTCALQFGKLSLTLTVA